MSPISWSVVTVSSGRPVRSETSTVRSAGAAVCARGAKTQSARLCREARVFSPAGNRTTCRSAPRRRRLSRWVSRATAGRRSVRTAAGPTTSPTSPGRSSSCRSSMRSSRSASRCSSRARRRSTGPSLSASEAIPRVMRWRRSQRTDGSGTNTVRDASSGTVPSRSAASWVEDSSPARRNGSTNCRLSSHVRSRTNWTPLPVSSRPAGARSRSRAGAAPKAASQSSSASTARVGRSSSAREISPKRARSSGSNSSARSISVSSSSPPSPAPRSACRVTRDSSTTRRAGRSAPCPPPTRTQAMSMAASGLLPRPVSSSHWSTSSARKRSAGDVTAGSGKATEPTRVRCRCRHIETTGRLTLASRAMSPIDNSASLTAYTS
jgi:hypothetical protein